MNWHKQKYYDRFGNKWSVRVDVGPGTRRSVAFTHKNLRLIAEDGSSRADPALERLQELFCGAERVLDHGGERWYVGYRRQTGATGPTLPGMYTWFRSENGEVRCCQGMLQFRHMSPIALCKHLHAAAPVANERARVRWAT